MVGETRFEMHATTPTAALQANLPSLGQSNGPLHAAYLRAMGLPTRRRFQLVACNAEIFKKTLCAADLKPAGRDVAKDMPEVGGTLLCVPSDTNLTDEKITARQSEWMPRATNHRSKALWKYARRIGTANSTVSCPGGVHEKQCYADV